MHELSDFWPFFTAFAALAVAGFGVPIPEELATIGAGIWAGKNPDFGPMRWLILPVCLLGVLCSDLMLYGIGRWSGTKLLERAWVKRLLPQKRLERIEGNFDRYGVKVLLLIRWVPAIRSPMFISAGIMRLPILRFIVADAIAAAFGHSILFFLAYVFGDQFRETVTQAEHQLKPLLVLLMLAAVAGFLLYHFMRQPVSSADPHELPLIGDQVAAKIDYSTETIPAIHGGGRQALISNDGEPTDENRTTESNPEKARPPTPNA